MKSTTKVIEIKEIPTLKNPTMFSGIRDRATAEAWGVKNGYPTVYFLSKRQRVYAEKLTARVDVAASKIEQASADLVSVAEGAL
jgi:hypothetical protein